VRLHCDRAQELQEPVLGPLGSTTIGTDRRIYVEALPARVRQLLYIASRRQVNATRYARRCYWLSNPFIDSMGDTNGRPPQIHNPNAIAPTREK
jgi:hypothetical protein